MPNPTPMNDSPDLRSRATARLHPRASAAAGASTSEALGVLFQLASRADTAPKALALLHELQVHQVELELQDEELRSSRVALEAALARQTELYDLAPVSCFTVDAATTLHELNLSGARLLGGPRETLEGRPLAGFLTPRNADALHTLLLRTRESSARESCELAIAAASGQTLRIHAAATPDSVAQRFLLAFTVLG